MAAALPDRSFSYIFFGFPGSVHDSTVFQNSSLFQKLEDQENKIFNPQTYHIIANSACKTLKREFPSGFATQGFKG
jgi:hypothetical protein